MPAQPRLIAPSDTSFWDEWGRWSPALQKALETDRYALADVLEKVLRGEAQLWTAQTAVVVTEIGVYPRRKVLRCWLAAGAYEGIREIEPRAVAFGKAHGCTAIEIIGRVGWRRRLKDYRERAVVMVKEL